MFAGTQGGIMAGQLFALLAAHGPNLQEFECDNIAILRPLSLRSLKLFGKHRAGPELSMSTLGSLSPTLEVLELSNYISLGATMRLPLHLPRLEVLSFCVEPQAIPVATYMSHLSRASLDRIRAIWLSHPFTLTVRSNQWEEPEPEKLEMCAKAFAMTWPHMNLHFRGHDVASVTVPVHVWLAALMQKKVAYYSKLVLENGELRRF
ncbi:hypothetical protein BDV93DRAFT_524041 [Ceratobasidium sp. AG-I]|nr:hypothetical protein BDV93DRAFT_524041 [Ceratobasidium sp. AG-I]